jgi:hypothetical protein
MKTTAYSSLIHKTLTSEIVPLTRPVDWLPLPIITNSGNTETSAGLCAITHNTTLCISVPQVLAPTLSMPVTVDWGDGSSDTTVGDVPFTAEHVYDYDTLAGGTIEIDGVTYKQALVTITVTASPGQLYVLNMCAPHTTGQVVNRWLDIIVTGPNLNQLHIGGNNIAYPNGRSPLLQRFQLVGPNNITSFDALCSDLKALTAIPIMSVTNGITFNSLFEGCDALAEIPHLDTSAGTSFNAMFLGCSSLQTVPLLDTSQGTDFTEMFYGCGALTTVSVLDTSQGTTFNDMFGLCGSLREIPSLTLSQANTCSYMFGSCRSLVTTPPLSAPLCVDFSGMFSECTSLKTVSTIDTSSGELFSGMFEGCTNLLTVPPLDLSQAIDISYIFSYCRALLTVPNLTMPVGPAIGPSIFSSCESLVSCPPLGVGTLTDMAGFFFGCSSVISAALIGGTVEIDYSGCTGLSAGALDAIFTSLGDGPLPGTTITISGCAGEFACDTTIATNKGWTVI